MLKDRISLTEEEIDDMLSAKDQEYHNMNLPRLWRKIKDMSFKSLHAYYLINEDNKVKYPFLEFVQILKTCLEYQITRQEASEMTFEKFINQKSNNGELQETFSMFLRDYYVLSTFNNFVTQEPLPIANASVLYGHVFDESFTSESATVMLPALEMLICNVNCRNDGEISVKNYISQKTDLSILTENVKFCGMFSDKVRLKHLISLYERMESMKTYNFDSIDAKYKEPLSQRMRMQLLRHINFEEQFHDNQISAGELLIALKRFLIRYLMIESSENISPEYELTNIINEEDFNCWPSSSSLEVAKKLFPSDIRVGQTYSIYELINSRQTSS
ncbi:25854_t:CDS:2 [Dentiscutata erythropus]|uniref:25854_t:CDS:1 n=1 Tax=Dentiscutata erythropus TaxID=1348616 RepID=A0A9N9C1E8_9GLOM|nr:25854_t:CDS:2 [Dentiscutata erythropus]